MYRTTTYISTDKVNKLKYCHSAFDVGIKIPSIYNSVTYIFDLLKKESECV